MSPPVNQVLVELIGLAVLVLAADVCALALWWAPYYTHGPALWSWRVRAASHEALDVQARRLWESTRDGVAPPIKLVPIDATTVMFRESMAFGHLWVYPLVLRGCINGIPGEQPLVVTVRPCLWPWILAALFFGGGTHDWRMRLGNAAVVAVFFFAPIAVLQWIRFRVVAQGFGTILRWRTPSDRAPHRGGTGD